MPGIDAAMERFDAEAKAEAPAQAVAVATPTERVEKPDIRVSEPAAVEALDSKPLAPDTRATAEKPVAPVPDKSTEVKTEEAPKVETKAEAEKSRYAKSQERLTRTWEQVNADKAAFAADKAKLETERTEFAKKQAEFQAIQKQAESPQYQPADYQTASQQKKALADHQRAEAKRLEDGGKFAEAEKLVKQAAKNDALSEDLAEHAESLRKNPPASYQQRAQAFEQARQAWTIEAAKAFPDLAKDNSPFQQVVAGHLNALAKSDPQLMAHPSVIYHVARLAAAEQKAVSLQADAARVPVLVKEAESLRAKIKELETLTTPGGSGSAARLGADAPSDDANALRQAASEMGSRFW